MSDNIQGDPKRRLVDAPKALKSFKDTQLSSLSSRRVNKKPTVMPVMPGVEANHTAALKTLHQKISEPKCNSHLKLRDADQHTFQHDEPALSATRHSKRGDKSSGSNMLEKVSSDFKVKIKIAQAGPGSKENRASKQQLPVEENMLTPRSSMDESTENSDPLQSRYTL
ncbi:hypothetical protein O6H91_01G115900 [Diphasiastrum complanatum]|nr:hypothetical protein O6H91_01G115900 [Diphasiastrum complanatum]